MNDSNSPFSLSTPERKRVSFAIDKEEPEIKKFNVRDPVFALHLPRSVSINVPSRSNEEIGLLLEKQNVLVTALYYNFNHIRGSAFVKNLSFQKDVSVMYTFNAWENGNDRRALYKGPVKDFPRGHVDEFLFEIDLLPSGSDRSCLLSFAIRYSVNGKEFWDNNEGKNYSVDYFYTGPSRKNQRFHMPVKPIHKNPSKSAGKYEWIDSSGGYMQEHVEEEVVPTRRMVQIPRCPSFDTYVDETNNSRYRMPPVSGFSPFL